MKNTSTPLIPGWRGSAKRNQTSQSQKLSHLPWPSMNKELAPSQVHLHTGLFTHLLQIRHRHSSDSVFTMFGEAVTVAHAHSTISKAGFLIWHSYSFRGASPNGYISCSVCASVLTVNWVWRCFICNMHKLRSKCWHVTSSMATLWNGLNFFSNMQQIHHSEPFPTVAVNKLQTLWKSFIPPKLLTQCTERNHDNPASTSQKSFKVLYCYNAGVITLATWRRVTAVMNSFILSDWCWHNSRNQKHGKSN